MKEILFYILAIICPYLADYFFPERHDEIFDYGDEYL
jgi:hypothetical protein